MSMDIPTVMDPSMPEELYNKINGMIDYFSEEYDKKISSGKIEMEEIKIDND